MKRLMLNTFALGVIAVGAMMLGPSPARALLDDEGPFVLNPDLGAGTGGGGGGQYCCQAPTCKCCGNTEAKCNSNGCSCS